MPSRGVITLNGSTITLASDAVFRPECTGAGQVAGPDPSGASQLSHDLREPFYASTLPQAYALAVSTALSFTIFLMLVLTPRTFFVGSSAGGGGSITRRGLISGGTRGSPPVGQGKRPWLQFVAAGTVCISLVIASVDTYNIAKDQYETGLIYAQTLRDQVATSLEIRIVRVISDTFLWLAQVQTLIRLFPRHKEKVIIKWTGFALIVLDTVFTILNSFAYSGATRPRSFVDAIPALSYLFELALSLLYAAWVIYYSLSKRRFAFYHPKLRNICLVAALSLVAVLVPVVFFVLDISKPDVAGWGDYVRWVGQAAASVVVWEWVERIEALEREDRKDGVLGREIFDGDEMLDVTPSEEVNWPGNHWRDHRYGDGDEEGGAGPGLTAVDRLRGGLVRRLPHSQGPLDSEYNPRDQRGNQVSFANAVAPQRSSRRPGSPYNNTALPTSPLPVASPVSRSDTVSASSTVYAIHYQNVSENSTTPDHAAENGEEDVPPKGLDEQEISAEHDNHSTHSGDSAAPGVEGGAAATTGGSHARRWATPANPFKRRKAAPPPEVAVAIQQTASRQVNTAEESQLPNNSESTGLKSKLGRLVALRSERPRGRGAGRDNELDLPVMVIPAQPAGRTWSPPINSEPT